MVGAEYFNSMKRNRKTLKCKSHFKYHFSSRSFAIDNLISINIARTATGSHTKCLLFSKCQSIPPVCDIHRHGMYLIETFPFSILFFYFSFDLAKEINNFTAGREKLLELHFFFFFELTCSEQYTTTKSRSTQFHPTSKQKKEN